jgi:hypothetical protein
MEIGSNKPPENDDAARRMEARRRHESFRRPIDRHGNVQDRQRFASIETETTKSPGRNSPYALNFRRRRFCLKLSTKTRKNLENLTPKC